MQVSAGRQRVRVIAGVDHSIKLHRRAARAPLVGGPGGAVDWLPRRQNHPEWTDRVAQGRCSFLPLEPDSRDSDTVGPQGAATEGVHSLARSQREHSRELRLPAPRRSAGVQPQQMASLASCRIM